MSAFRLFSRAMPRVLPVGMLVAVSLLSACGGIRGAAGTVTSAVKPYRIEVVQGNFVSKEQVAALKPGLTRQQVKEVLGTPLLMNIFREDRWDYVFTIRRQGVEPQSRRLTVYFKGDLLDRFEGDEMPSESEFVASLDSHRKDKTVPTLEATDEQLKKFPTPAQPADPAAPAAAADPAATVYPPLEAPRR